MIAKMKTFKGRPAIDFARSMAVVSGREENARESGYSKTPANDRHNRD
jgi:hypothetical protein